MTTFAMERWRDRNWLVKDVAHLEPRPAAPKPEPVRVLEPLTLVDLFDLRYGPESRWSALRSAQPGDAGGVFTPYDGWEVYQAREACACWLEALAEGA